MAEGRDDLSRVSGGGGDKGDPDSKPHDTGSTKSGKKVRIEKEA